MECSFDSCFVVVDSVLINIFASCKVLRILVS